MKKFMDNDIVNLRQRYQSCKGTRSVVEGVWDEIEKYVAPYRGQFFKTDTQEGDVEWRKRWVYDSVPVESCAHLAASLNGSLTSSMVKWFGLQFKIDELNDDVDAKEWLEECEDICFESLKESNFNLESNEVYLDLTAFGNSVAIEEIEGTYEDFQGLDFKAIPIKECFFEMTFKDQVKRFYRRMFLTAVQMVDKFGLEGCPEDIVTKANNPTSVDQKHEVVMAIYEREEVLDMVKKGKVDLSKPLAPEKRPFGFKWFIEATAEPLGDTGGYYEMPAFVVRWRKASGSQWGFGPSHIAMGDVLTLNQMVDFILSAAEKAIDPPTITEDRGLLSDLDLNAGGLTVVRNINGIKPYESAARFDVSQINRDDIRASIRRMFYIDQLQLKDSPAMTATEVQVRYEMMQRLLGGTMGRIQNDFLDPLIQRTFNILYRAGQLPPPPDVVLESDATMEVEYTGPMARAQKSDQAASIERYVQNTAQVSQFYPEVLDLIDPMAMAREEAQLLGVPSKVQRSDSEIKKIQDERKQQQAMAQAMMQAQAGGQAMQNVAGGMQAMQEVQGGQGISEGNQRAAA